MLIRTPAFLVALLLPGLALAQAAPAHQVIYLWPNGAPGFEKLKDRPERSTPTNVGQVNNPSLEVFLPPKGRANGCAVVIAPGGGFRSLVYLGEGTQPAQYLNSLGVTAFVLKYRLAREKDSPYTLENAYQDGARALRVVRSRAAEFGIDPNRIGLLGFSAGGMVALAVSFHSGTGDPTAADPIDRLDPRPDFQMLIYPGGKELVPDQIPADAPPTFLAVCGDDEYHCDQAVLSILEKYDAAKASVEVHFFAQGRHGFHLGDQSDYLAVRHWADRMADWLNDRGFLRPN